MIIQLVPQYNISKIDIIKIPFTLRSIILTENFIFSPHNKFQPNAVIFHHGEMIKSGHYTCWLRSNIESRWYELDDEYKKPFLTIPRNLDCPYIFVLNRI